MWSLIIYRQASVERNLKMQIIYTGQSAPEKFTRSIFLAGPSPRQSGLTSWRKDAIALLEEQGFDGVVFSPEHEREKAPGEFHGYDTQVGWEKEHLNMADVVLFYVPRDLKTFPAFTTNIEFGKYVGRRDTVYGRPDDAPKNKYLDGLYTDTTGQTPFSTLEETIASAVEKTKEGVERQGGERDIPLFVWNTKTFQNWYQAHKGAGNRIDGAELLYHKDIHGRVFLHVIWAKVWVEAEQRHKENELFVGRSDISTICAFHKGSTLAETKLVLVREFRTTISTGDCFVRELPGGSSVKPHEDALTVASHEFEEETGIQISPERFSQVGERQLVSTLSTHKAALFMVELNDEELAVAEKEYADKTMHGLIESSEQTYVEVYTYDELLRTNIDWSMLGMIGQALYLVEDKQLSLVEAE